MLEDTGSMIDGRIDVDNKLHCREKLSVTFLIKPFQYLFVFEGVYHVAETVE
jgi:hypothetical protein